MERRAPSRAELYGVIERLTAEIERLRAENARLLGRVEELEATLASGEPPPARPPAWVKPNEAGRTGPKKARKKRAVNCARRRAAEPDRRVEHALASCPDCGCGLRGGTLKRRREVIELELRPAVTTEHVLIERVCPVCARAGVPRLGPAEGVVGRHRFGPTLLALIGTWREVGRLPLEVIQTLLRTFHRVEVSLGAIDGALKELAARGASAVAAIRGEIITSPVVSGDETGWREDGQNGYLWQISTPTACYFERGPRTNEQIDAILGKDFAGTLVTDFYAAYDHFPGLKQRCWAHLLRDVRELEAAHPTDSALRRWGRHLRRLFRATRDRPGATADQRRATRQRAEVFLTRLCAPFLTETRAPQRTLCQRIEKHRAELFTFVTDPAVPPTNNAAERAFRPLVVARKIWGGTRSARGTIDAMRRASLVATWKKRGLNPFDQFRDLLLSPQL